MCLIAFAWGADSRFPFVIAANRDEVLARPTASLSEWLSLGGTRVLAGRDLRDGGTWMGFSPHGRFAMLTNVRDPNAKAPEQAISRGSLALAWLESGLSAQAWALSIEPQRYQGFNLIVGDWPHKQCHYLSNQGFSKPFRQLARMQSTSIATDLIVKEMPWGAVYGLSNAELDTAWPKTLALKSALQNHMTATDAQALIALNMQALASQDKPQDRDLPQTGVSLELERALSSAFVRHPPDLPHYGTRTSLVAVLEAGHGLRVTELTHAQSGGKAHTAESALAWV